MQINQKYFFNSQFQFQIKFKCNILYHNGTEQCISMQFSYIYIVLCNFSYTHSGIILSVDATLDSGSTVHCGWNQFIPSCQLSRLTRTCQLLATGDGLIPTTGNHTAWVLCCIDAENYSTVGVRKVAQDDVNVRKLHWNVLLCAIVVENVTLELNLKLKL